MTTDLTPEHSAGSPDKAQRLVAALAAPEYTASAEKAPINWAEQHEADKLRYALMGLSGNEVPSLLQQDFEAAYLQGMKDGATAAVGAIVSTLEKSWIMRLAMRITPLTVLRKVVEELPAVVDQLPPA